eukprot:2406785-Prymnesium_polylepis.1
MRQPSSPPAPPATAIDAAAFATAAGAAAVIPSPHHARRAHLGGDSLRVDDVTQRGVRAHEHRIALVVD